MSTFKEIQRNINKISPTLRIQANPVEGEMWYNQTTLSLKGFLNIGGAISSGGNLNTGRRNMAGTGTQTAGLAIAGGPPSTGATEEYNGTSWSEQNDVPQGTQQMAGAGTQTATQLLVVK